MHSLGKASQADRASISLTGGSWAAGGENGFNQAIELSADTLANVKFVQEKRLISKFFDEISQDTGKYVFGVKDTLSCLEMGAVETLIVWESLDVSRYELMNSSTGEIVVKHLNSQQVGLCPCLLSLCSGGGHLANT